MSTLRVPTKGSIASKAINFNIDSELMRNQAPATVVDPQHAMAVISDQQGNPMMFSVGNDGVLYVVMRDARSTSGWRQYDLSSALGAGKRVTTFTVSQGQDHRIILAAAVAPSATPLEATLYLTPPITPDPTLTKWSEIGRQWVSRPFPQGTVAITEILIGQADDDGAPLGIAAVQQGAAAELYRINTDARDTLWSWQSFPLPENASGPVVDLAVGKVMGDWGVYALYPTSTGQTLEFTTLPDPKYHKVSRYQFPLPAPATVIAALPADGDSYDLYFAGDGIHLYRASGTSRTTIAGATALNGIQHLLVSQDSTTAAVYAITDQQVLLYCGGLRSKAGQWSPPVPIRRQVSQLTAMRSTTRLSNEIFIVKANSTLAYVYQDPVRSLWNETAIKLPSLSKIVDLKTYTVHIAVQGEDGAALFGRNFALTASSWAYATINGYAYSLDDQRPVNVSPDVYGTITIIIQTETIAAPVIHLSADFLTQVVDIVPTTNVRAGLDKIRSGDDLRKATLKNGSRLLTKNVDDKTLNSSAQAVQQLTKLVATPPEKQARTFAGVARPPAAEPALAVGAPAAGQVWGMHFDAGGAQHVEGAAARTHFSDRWALAPKPGPHPAAAAAHPGPASPAAALLDPGSALEWLWDGIKQVGSFLVETFEGVVNFVFQIGKELFRFVVDCAEAAYRLIHWVLLKTLDIDLDKFIEWLGFIFDWEDIKRVHTMMVGLMNDTLTFGRQQLDGYKNEVKAWFENLKRQLKTLQPDTDTRTIFTRGSEFQSANAAADATRQRLMSSPGSNWGQYHLTHSGAVSGIAIPNMPVSDPFTAFMNDVVRPTLDSVSKTAQQLGADFNTLFNDRTLTTAQSLQKLAGDLATGLLDAAEKIVTGLIQFIEDLVALVQKGLNTKLEIPFFSAFYKSIAGSDLTILDAVMLVLAVPTTIIYKIATNSSPVLDPKTRIFPIASHDVSHDARQAGVNRSRRMMAAGGARAAAAHVDKEEPKDEPKKDELTQGQKDYQKFGGWWTLFAQAVGDALAVAQAYSVGEAGVEDNIEAAEGFRATAEKLGLFRTGANLAKLAGCYPLGNDPEVGWQRGIWFFELASPLIELGIDRGVRGGLKRQATGVWLIVDGIVVLVLECVVFGYEMSNSKSKDEERVMDGIKFGQNLCYEIGTISSGVLNLVKGGSPAAIAALVGSIAGAVLGGGINIIRLVETTGKGLEYQRY